MLGKYCSVTISAFTVLFVLLLLNSAVWAQSPVDIQTHLKGLEVSAPEAERTSDDTAGLVSADPHVQPSGVREVTSHSAANVPTSQAGLSAGIHLATGSSSVISDVGAGADAGTGGPSSSSNTSGGDLDEVVVTAQKRSERLQDVPIPVTAVNANTLLDSHQTRLQDYYIKIPGVAITPDDTDGVGASAIVIRGITTGSYTSPTVGITIDDVPYGSSTALGGGAAAPDIDPSDLARVEVLRGPQGTLYGVNSFGGLLKFVTIDPSTDALSGHVEADGSGVQNGDGLGYGVRAGINVPVSDTMAIRASAFSRVDPGYVDNVVTGQRGVNKTDDDGGRLAALWKPADNTSLKFSALVQHTRADGSSIVDPTLGDLNQGIVAGGGGYEKTIQAYSLTFKTKLGLLDFVSLTGFNTNELNSRADFTPSLGSLTESTFGVTGTPVIEHNKTRKITQEFRVSAPIGTRVDWLFGAFYTHESNKFWATIDADNPVTGQVVGIWENSDSYPSTYEEYSAFTDITLHITDIFDIQVGGREGHNRQSYSETILGGPSVLTLYGESAPIVQPLIVTNASSFTYLFTPELKLSHDMMVYARVASGYRAGGPNTLASVLDLPSSFKPDTTKNYEVGLKGDFFDHIISIDTSVYYIDWKDIQLQLEATCLCTFYFANASRAKSDGIEFSVGSKPIQGLSLNAWVAFNDAALTQGFPPASAAYGVSGDRLPYASRFSGNVSLDFEHLIAGNIKGFFGASTSYIGNREGVFTLTSQRQPLSAYAQSDMRVGVRVSSWTTSVFVDNIADKRGVLGGGIGSFYPPGFTYIRPRTVGLSVSTMF